MEASQIFEEPVIVEEEALVLTDETSAVPTAETTLNKVEEAMCTTPGRFATNVLEALSTLG